jgi:hypothetical protein
LVGQLPCLEAAHELINTAVIAINNKKRIVFFIEKIL